MRWALGLASLTACSALASFDGLAGNDVTDGGGPSVDGGVDASAIGNDGGAPDASSDAQSDATATRFCAGSTHAFCADFDEGDVDSGFTGSEIDPVGSVTISTAQSKSAPGSLSSQLPRHATGDLRATLDKSFDGWPHVVVELDVYIDAPSWEPSDINAAFLAIELYSAAGNSGVYWAVGEAYSNIGGPTGMDQFGMSTPTNTWVHARFDVDPLQQYSVVIGANTYTKTFAPPTMGGGPHMNIGIGVDGYNAPAPAFNVYYDNVTIDLP